MAETPSLSQALDHIRALIILAENGTDASFVEWEALAAAKAFLTTIESEPVCAKTAQTESPSAAPAVEAECCGSCPDGTCPLLADRGELATLTAKLQEQGELMRKAVGQLESLAPRPENTGSTKYHCGICLAPWRSTGGGIDHKPDCLVTKLRTASPENHHA